MLYLNHFDLTPRLPLARLRADGWDGLRRNVRSLSEAIVVCKQHDAGALGVLLLLDEPADADVVQLAAEISGLPLRGLAIEVGNEWDRKGVDPEDARAIWLACRLRMNPRATLVTGGVSNLSDASWTWLGRATRDLPTEVVLGIHGYPGENRPDDPREDPGRYRHFSLGRTYWNTETGWDRGPHPRGFPLCWFEKRRSEQDQADCFAEDARQAQQAGLWMYVAYQVADGPADTPTNRHGLYRDDGSARPAVAALVAAHGGA